MKNIALVVLSIAVVVLAGLYVRERGKVAVAQGDVLGLEEKVGEIQGTVEAVEKKSAGLRTELDQARTEAAAKAREVAQLKLGSTNPVQSMSAAMKAAGAGGSSRRTEGKAASPLSALAKMFEDPEMKEAIATQQRAAMGPIIDKTYGKLFSDLHLTPEQTASLKEMLLNKQMAGTQMGMSMLSEGTDSAKTKELGEKVKAANDAADAEIKGFLGDEKYAQLKTYEKSTADRMAISGFKDQLGASAALTAEQEQQLIDAMTKERANFKFTTDLADKSKGVADIASRFSEENVNRYIQELDQLNQHFVSYAQNILTPDQLESFQKYLNNQQAMQKVGMQMGAKMFATEKPEK